MKLRDSLKVAVIGTSTL